MDYKPKISVCMITYGHENYILQAIEGVLMQECNFEIELIIANDCSPDNTDLVVKDILAHHPKKSWIKYFNHKKNLGMMPNFLFALDQCSGNYIAVCEGDDYWTDPLKLQRQVDFLEANKEYTICWTKYLIKESENLSSLVEPDWVSQIEKNKNITIDLDTIFTPYCTYTLTVLFKRKSLDLPLLKSLKHSKDNSLYALCLSKGKGILIDSFSAVYRLHEGGVYSSASFFKQRYHSYLNLKEITFRIPLCDNSNIRNVRNYLLWESIKLHPNHFSLNYIKLIKDRLIFLGIKGSLSFIYHKFLK